jgi:hypothetical protein
MENSLKGLILAAGTIITCVVITLGFYLSKEAQATATAGTSQIGKINSEFAESDKIIYDGTKVSGNEVINAIKKMQGQEVGVYVATMETNTYYGYEFDLNNGDLEGITHNTYESTLSAQSDDYINPYAMFAGSVIRNENNAITGICFIQQ